MSPRIAVIGAGPAGLTLGRILTQNSIDVTLFEREASPNVRGQGGTLDLHDESGLKAVKAGGLYQEFLKHARYDADVTVFTDKHNKVFLDTSQLGPGAPADDDAHGDHGKKPDELKRPEIDREKLRQILLNSVPEGIIKWGHRLTKIEDGNLVFDDTKVGPFDLIVGADGAWSKVRTLLTDIRPSYAGISGFELHHAADHEYPRLSSMIGKGSYFSFSDEKALMGQRMGDGTIKVSAYSKTSENYPKELFGSYSGKALKDKILEVFNDWDPTLQGLIKYADADNVKPWALYELPVNHTWEHRKGYTAVGDAARLMTPFAGEGVNAAMLDSYELAEAILKGKDGDLEREVEKYEKGMFPRSEETCWRTMRNKTYMFRHDAPQGFMEVMNAAIAKAYKAKGAEDLLKPGGK